MTILKNKTADTNISERERLASLIGGGSLVAYGLVRRNLGGFAMAAIGGGLMLRGATGHCDVYEAMGMSTAERNKARGTGRHTSIPYELGIRIDHSILVKKPVNEVYQFWRNLENLPRFMNHLKSVEVQTDKRSHWVATGPAGFDVEWDAEIINEIPEKVIGWRSLEGSTVDNAGSVRFESVGDSTKVSVSLQYNPPAGSLGEIVAKLFGEDPKKQVKEDMGRFRELLETGKMSMQKRTPRQNQPQKVWDRDKVMEASEESFPASDPPSWTPEKV